MASDPFNRANESPLGPPYNHVGAASDLVSNQVTQGGGGLTYRTGATAAFSQIVYISGDVGGPAIHVDSSGNGYLFYREGIEVIIARSDGGSLTEIGAVVGTFVSNDVVSIRRVGNAMVGRINGVDVLTSSNDTTYTSGEDGWGSFDSLTLDDWTNESASVALSGFRFYNDDGDEDGSTAAAAQDANLSAATAVNKILRLQLQATNDPASITFTLRAQKNGSGGYTAVPVGATTITTPTQPTSATVTTVGTAADPWTINRATASAGDMVVFVLAWDDSTTVTSVTPPSGPNGETAVSIAGPVASNGTEMRMQAWYYIATGSWSAGTLSFDPSASETVRAVSFAIPAAQFNASDPIGWSNTAASAGTAESTINSPTGTAESNDGSGRLFIAYGSDADAITAPASGTTTVNNATGGGVGLCVVSRDTVVSNSESVANITASIASDSWASLAFVVKPNVVNNEIYVSPSTNITAGGEATTQRLTGGSGSFTTGRMWDDENGIDGIDIGDGNNTELAWCLQLAASLSPGDYFDLLPYNADSALSGTAARWTVGGAIELTVGDCAHAHAADAPALTQANTLAVGDAAHGHIADAVTLGLSFTLEVGQAVHAHAADGVTLTQANVLAPASAAHGHHANAPELTQANTLGVGEAAHAQASDSITLVQDHILAIAESIHQHATDGVVLSTSQLLDVEDAVHVHVAEAVALNQANVLAIEDAIHAHAADAADLSSSGFLNVGESVHGHATNAPHLAQASILTIGDAVHTLASAQILLSQGVVIAVEDAIHAQASDGAELSSAAVLAIASAMHLHEVDAVDLAQAATLIVSDSVHALISQQIALLMPGGMPVPPGQTIVVQTKSRVIVVEPKSRTISIHAVSRSIRVH